MKELVGAKLYEVIKRGSITSEKDKKIYDQMQKHKFVTLKILELPQYSDE